MGQSVQNVYLPVSDGWVFKDGFSDDADNHRNEIKNERLTVYLYLRITGWKILNSIKYYV